MAPGKLLICEMSQTEQWDMELISTSNNKGEKHWHQHSIAG